MIRILYLLQKPENMSKEQFDQECLVHFEMSHAIPGLYKYEVRLIASEPTDIHVPFFDIQAVDAIGECWFEDETQMQIYLDSEIRKNWFEHGKTFIGKLKPFVTKDIV
ncbi:MULTISPECIES: 4-methylmuconolactone methylisomerase [unclassified Acinetobacter]|uniref:4-methylmuconolactone methylisomerase n=1 Tax=unclassified Acinetobacter TaxID=196816 RepID=UPI0029343F69|nr:MULTISPECIES: 4-methylmuconolactone methylisomerase [unclassified Acinetobacter]WOE32953.1 4-methylmuconolactone methylisomerase [Acinetobacter sp. SAAs470]WOE38430.1 4-methylmuconolactone methylisomerase [Acinetobacter sp. SAAs474]